MKFKFFYQKIYFFFLIKLDYRNSFFYFINYYNIELKEFF
jgi:hypothetical protein